VLALLLVATGQGVAIARGMPGPAGQMVICTGTGPVMIIVDATGQPTGHAQYCPEAAQSLLHALFGTPQVLPRTLRMVRAVELREVTHQAGLARAAPQARGPPARV